MSGDRSVRVEWVDLDEVTADADGLTHAWCEVLDAGHLLQRERVLVDLHGRLMELCRRRSLPKPVRQPAVVELREPQPRFRWEGPVPRLSGKVELPPIDWRTASARERCDWYREAGRRATVAIEAARLNDFGRF